MLKIARFAGDCLVRLCLLAGLGLALAACSKCDVPTWPPTWPPKFGGPPSSCHDEAPVR